MKLLFLCLLAALSVTTVSAAVEPHYIYIRQTYIGVPLSSPYIPVYQWNGQYYVLIGWRQNECACHGPVLPRPRRRQLN